MEDDSMWRSCINTKYGSQNGGWFTSYPRGSYGVSVWKSIAKETEHLKKDCVFKLGDGRKIRFWEDTWCGRQALCDAFPSLYSTTGSKGAKAAEIWVREDGGGAWDPKFMRSFNDWEMEAIQGFIMVISNIKFSPLEKDKLS